jgi:RNA polymerase sigma-70 factor (ECF subfamily)
MADCPAALAIVDALAADGALDGYHLLHTARGHFAQRLGHLAEAEKSYARARDLASNDSERRFLSRQLREARERR